MLVELLQQLNSLVFEDSLGQAEVRALGIEVKREDRAIATEFVVLAAKHDSLHASQIKGVSTHYARFHSDIQRDPGPPNIDALPSHGADAIDLAMRRRLFDF